MLLQIKICKLKLLVIFMLHYLQVGEFKSDAVLLKPVNPIDHRDFCSESDPECKNPIFEGKIRIEITNYGMLIKRGSTIHIFGKFDGKICLIQFVEDPKYYMINCSHIIITKEISSEKTNLLESNINSGDHLKPSSDVVDGPGIETFYDAEEKVLKDNTNEIVDDELSTVDNTNEIVDDELSTVVEEEENDFNYSINISNQNSKKTTVSVSKSNMNGNISPSPAIQNEHSTETIQTTNSNGSVVNNDKKIEENPDSISNSAQGMEANNNNNFKAIENVYESPVNTIYVSEEKTKSEASTNTTHILEKKTILEASKNTTDVLEEKTIPEASKNTTDVLEEKTIPEASKNTTDVLKEKTIPEAFTNTTDELEEKAIPESFTNTTNILEKKTIPEVSTNTTDVLEKKIMFEASTNKKDVLEEKTVPEASTNKIDVPEASIYTADLSDEASENAEFMPEEKKNSQPLQNIIDEQGDIKIPKPSSNIKETIEKKKMLEASQNESVKDYSKSSTEKLKNVNIRDEPPTAIPFYPGLVKNNNPLNDKHLLEEGNLKKDKLVQDINNHKQVVVDKYENSEKNTKDFQKSSKVEKNKQFTDEVVEPYSSLVHTSDETSFVTNLIEILKAIKKDLTENSFYTTYFKDLENSSFQEYPSIVLLCNTVLVLILILMVNCLKVRQCNNNIRAELYMCRKKLLESNMEKNKVDELINEKDEVFEFSTKLQEENSKQKLELNKLACKISELQEQESVLKKTAEDYKTKYESLEEASNKKNIKKNYELLMGEVIVQKKKLDELAAKMEDRAQVLRQEKENIESLLKIQAEEHNRTVEDYRILLGNLELENKELRDIVQTISLDSSATQKIMDKVSLQVHLSNLEKDNENLSHQLEDEREAHKLLEDHQRMTQKEVHELRESYETIVKEKIDLNNKLKYITDYFQQLEDKLKKELADKDDLLNEKLGDDDSLAKALTNLRKENCVLNEENSILRNKYESLKVELTDQKNEEKLTKTKLENEREKIWMAWRINERKIESLNLDNKILRSKLVAMGSKSETSFREMHTQTYEDQAKILSPTSSLYLEHSSPVPQPSFFMAIPPPPLSDDEIRQMYGPNGFSINEISHHGYHTDGDHEYSPNDHRLPPLGGGTYSPPILDNIPIHNIPPPLDNDMLWKLEKMSDPNQPWNSHMDENNEDEVPSYNNPQYNMYSRRRNGGSISSVSSRQSFV